MKRYIIARCLILFLIIISSSSTASAASIYLETSKDTVSAGDTFIVRVKIDAENKSINTVEGDIALVSPNNNFAVNDSVIAQSPFTLWPQAPSLSQDGKTISFVGGVPGGFNSDKINLFNIIVKTNREGDIEFSPKNIIAFRNDGQGTKLPVDVRNLVVKVVPSGTGGVESNEWVDLVNQDKDSPSIPLITLGRDSTLFEGRTFAFFTATDDQSGIDYYEVSEDGEPAVRSGDMYVLKNQDDAPRLIVTVYDKAGNKATASYKAPGSTILGFPLNFLTISIAILVALVILFFLLVLVLRIKNKMKRR
ncbi:MAG: hypothetical protein WC783_05035 [Candidatus Paceibacterota bacterium]|jgi:hypothetical protein